MVFGSPLNDKGYEDIKSLILNNHNRGFTKRGIERDGFILLQAKLCSNLKQEVVWKMLKGLNFDCIIRYLTDSYRIIVIFILARTLLMVSNPNSPTQNCPTENVPNCPNASSTNLKLSQSQTVLV